jgi:hypothetical protein
VNRNKLIQSLVIVFFLATLTFCQTSLLTGQSSYSVSLVSGVTLQYSGDMAIKAVTRNEVSPVSWVGLGWKFGIPSISVANNNTVDINDDRWFFNDGFDNISEIIRVNQGGNDKYYLKDSP